MCRSHHLYRAPLLLILFNLFAMAQPEPPELVWEQTAAPYINSIAFSPDGQYLAVGGAQSVTTLGQVDLFAASDGSLLAHAVSHGVGGQVGPANGVAFSPDGQTLASAHGSVYCQPKGGCSANRPGVLRWSVPSLGSLNGRIDLSLASSLDHAPDGTALAVGFFFDNSGEAGTLAIPSLATLLTVPGHQYTAGSVQFAPGGTEFASGGDDGFLRIWNAATGTERLTLEHGDYLSGGDPMSVAYSSDGGLIASSGSGYGLHVRVFDASDGSLNDEFDAGIQQPDYGGSTVVAFSPNGNYVVAGILQLVSGGRRSVIRFWDLRTGELALEVEEEVDQPNGGGVASLAFSPAQDSLFAYSIGDRVKMTHAPFLFADEPGGIIPCADVASFVARCNNAGTLQARVRFRTSDHDGKTVELTVDGTDVHEVDVVNRRAQVSLPAYGAGTHTVSLSDPAGCADDVVISCAAPAQADGSRNANAIPEVLVLEPNYPNPFNPETTLRFGLPGDAFATLTIFNSLGQQVRTLLDGHQAAGFREVRWDGTDDEGAKVASGTYIYRLKTGDVVASGRMMLSR